MKLALSLFLCLSILTSCAVKEPFTKKIKTDFSLGENELKGVQFYNSADIVLYKASSSGTKGTDKGSLVLSSESQEDRVIIRSGTPGVLEKLADDVVYVRFESGDQKYIPFAVREDQGGRYYIQAEEWKSGNGSVKYGGEDYVATQGSVSAYLLVVVRKLNKASRSERVAKGVRVN